MNAGTGRTDLSIDGALWRDLALFGVSLLGRNPSVTYGDVRFTSRADRTLSVKNGTVEQVAEGVDRGFGVRVLAYGAWGYTASSAMNEEGVAKAVAEALAVARASAASGREPVRICEAEPVTADVSFPVTEDPLAVPLDEILSMMIPLTREMAGIRGIRKAEAELEFSRQEKLFASTEGSFIRQRWTESGGIISAVAIENGEIQIRSYPNSHGGNQVQGGYEYIRRLDFPGNALRVAGEAVELLGADPCPEGVTDLVVGSSQMALQIHESCGHPAELDRVLGGEVSLAGGSFLTMDKLGSFRYGSPLVNIVADATVPGALGSFAFDDEGVPGSRFHLVQEGIFSGYLTSRETAADLGMERSNGTMRADGWQHLPLIRMTNINLEPGEGTLEDLVAGVDRGILVETNRSWSIDDLRLNFQFSTEMGREIRGGKAGRLLKNPIYTGITPQFWQSCDGVAGPEAWQVWGIPNCGKGEPLQSAHVAHGSPPARFRGVQVGVHR